MGWDGAYRRIGVNDIGALHHSDDPVGRHREGTEKGGGAGKFFRGGGTGGTVPADPPAR